MPRLRPDANSAPPPGDVNAPGDPWLRGAAAVLLVLLLIQGVIFIGESTQTSDEAAHIAAGYSYLTRGDFRLNPEHPPLVKELAALPLLPLDLAFPRGRLWENAQEWDLGRIFVHENRVSNDTILFLTRMPVLLLSILLGWTILCWTRALFGPRAGVVALALYALDPNVVAHSSLVTTDLGVTLFIFLSVYSFWSWSRDPSPRRLLLVGLSVGGTFASKFTALWLLPIFGALGLTLLLVGTRLPGRPWSSGSAFAGGGRLSPRRVAALTFAGLIVALVAAAVLTVTYAGHGLDAYILGLSRGLRHTAAGHRAYLMGEISEGGWWYYFLFAFLIKTPPGTLCIVVLSLLAMLRGIRRRLVDELFLWIPILSTVLITALWGIDIGLRHLLPIYPFLFVSAGRIVAEPNRLPASTARPLPRLATRLVYGAVALCLAWNLVEAFRITPYQLAYFNQFVGGPRNGHLYLLDSNLDWGQSSKALRRFMHDEGVPAIYAAYSGNSDPWYAGVHDQYVPGSGNLANAKNRPARLPAGLDRELFAISVMVRHSTHFSDHVLYDWLDEKKPIAMPGYSYLVYDITGDAASHANIALLCLNFRLYSLAEFESRRALALDPDDELARAVLEKIREDVETEGGSSPARAP